MFQSSFAYGTQRNRGAAGSGHRRRVSVGFTRFQHDPVRKSGPAPTPEEVMACTPPCNPVESAMELLEIPRWFLSQKHAPPLADRVSAFVWSQEEEMLGGSRTGNPGGHQASRCSQSQGRQGRKAELAREASAPLQVTTSVGVCDEIAHLKARLRSHTDRPHSSHAVFGASPGNPRIGWPGFRDNEKWQFEQ